jgi:Na+-driven multidrug efflux pump
LGSNNQKSNSKQYENVPNYLITSIIVTLFFLPFGIVAIVYAISVNAKVAAGDIQGARVASGTALMWCCLGAILSIILWVIFFVQLVSLANQQ